MTAKLHVLAPAKINLFLHILGRNPNGYHRLQTLFQLLNFGDELSFSLQAQPDILLTSTDRSIPLEENLIIRAATLLQKYASISQGVQIHLEKKIPLGAGLGGGSSDAGTTLRALNQLWNLNLSVETLCALGASLGADVPVFTLRENAWAEGIGEQLTPIKLPLQHYLILYPGCHVNTSSMFAHPDLPRNTPALDPQDYHFETTQNDFEALVCQQYPEVAKARQWLCQFGNARLTGSGSCLFLAIPSKAAGEAIQKSAPANWQLIVCESYVGCR